MLTSEVSRIYGVLPGTLGSLIRTRRMRAPKKDASGCYIWTPEDIEAVRAALLIDRRRSPYRTRRILEGVGNAL